MSAYKVNFSNFLILGSRFPTNIKKYLQGRIPFTWNSQGIPYLGTNLTPSAASLAQANFSTLFTKIKNKLQHMEQSKLTAGGMGLVNIQDHHWATLLNQLKHWLNKNRETPLWMSIELTLSPSQDRTKLLLRETPSHYNSNLIRLANSTQPA